MKFLSRQVERWHTRHTECLTELQLQSQTHQMPKKREDDSYHQMQR
jgi:hypothetical protein